LFCFIGLHIIHFVARPQSLGPLGPHYNSTVNKDVFYFIAVLHKHLRDYKVSAYMDHRRSYDFGWEPYKQIPSKY